MKVGDLVRYKQFSAPIITKVTSIGVVTSSDRGYVKVHWLGESCWSWEDNRDLQAVKKCP